MIVRRGFYLALRWAPIVLPLWLVVGLAFQSASSVGILALPLAGVALAAGIGLVLLFTWLRKGVRATRAVSWLDAGVLGVWFVLILATPFAPDGPLILFVLLAGIVAFWSALLQWIVETRQRVRAAMDDFGLSAPAVNEFRATRVTRPGPANPAAPLRGQVIRIDPPQEPER
jgi:hypothetical protein